MSYIEVNKNKCNGCGNCVKSCIFNSIKIVDKKAKIDLYSCTLCKACVNKCKLDAIKIIKINKKINSYGYKDIWVVVEYFNSEIKNTSFQLISKAFELSRFNGDEVTILLVGNKMPESDKKLKSTAPLSH